MERLDKPTSNVYAFAMNYEEEDARAYDGYGPAYDGSGGAVPAEVAADGETLPGQERLIPEWAPEPCDHPAAETCEMCELEAGLDAIIGELAADERTALETLDALFETILSYTMRRFMRDTYPPYPGGVPVVEEDYDDAA